MDTSAESIPVGATERLRCAVITADQRSSRTSPDAVPSLLTALSEVSTALPFVRTAGDEVQAVVTSPDALAEALAVLLRDGRWHVGVGLGTADLPLPDDTRAARGSAFLAARSAVEASSTGVSRPRVVAAHDADPSTAAALEAAVWLWGSLLAQRTPKGWEVCDLLDSGLNQREAGERLGIAQSAVNQRATAARLAEGRRGPELVATLAALHLETPARTDHAPDH